ncbi:MAG TPA: carboxypeptidase regulatory-like domain-containing protein [Thermoanaerobaculia bacterium]
MSRLLRGIVLFLVASRSLGQQIPLSTLMGVVSAEDGTPLAGVTVRLVSPALQGTREATTSRTGEYFLALLPPGDYSVRFASPNTQEVSRSVTLPAAGTVRLDQIVRPAAAESIHVTGETTSATGPEIGANFPQKLMNQLPSGRTLRDAALLAPGVNENGPASSLGSASPRQALMISGAVSYGSLYLVDGVVVNENLREQPQDLFIEDAIQETTVQTGRISAEYGRFTGGVVNLVTRSGGNNWSGSFRTTFSSDQWTANNAYDAARENDTRAHDLNEIYEATLGLPILKDHLWAFGAGRLANIDQSFATRPPPGPGNIDPTPVPYSYGRDEERIEGKVTAAPLPSVGLVASYINTHLDETNYAFNRNILSTETLMPRSLPYSLFAVNASGVASASLFLEGQYSRRNFEIEQTGPQPTDVIHGTTILDGDVNRFGAPQFSGEPPNIYNNDSFSVRASRLLSTGSWGEHDLRVGYERFQESTQEQNNFSSSGYVIGAGSIVRGTEVFPVFDPTTSIDWYPITAPAAPADLVTHSIYLNDRVSLGRHWSLNLGLRWDKNHDVNSSGELVSSEGSLSPRLGARFDPRGDGRLVFDVGYAKYVSQIHERIANAASPAGNAAAYQWIYGGPCINCNPFAPTSSLLSTDAALAQLFQWFESIGGTASPPAQGSLPGFSTRIAPGGLRSPYANEISAGAELALRTNGAIRADFVYRDYRDQYNGRIDLTTGQTPPDAFGNVSDIEEIGNSNQLKRSYTAVQFQAHYRFGNSLSAAATYTWSHLTANLVGEYNCCAAAWGLIDEYPEYKQASWNAPVGDLTGLGIAPFSADERHRARAWVVYQALLGKGTLSLAALEAFDSGLGYEAVGSIDPTPYVHNPGYANPLGNTLASGTVAYFFTKPGAFRTDNVTHTDLALDCSLPVFAPVEIFLHAQVFNLFNEQAVIAVNSNVLTNNDKPSIAPFNPFTDTPKQGFNYVLSPNFGKPTSSAGYQTPRTFQFAVGLRF